MTNHKHSTVCTVHTHTNTHTHTRGGKGRGEYVGFACTVSLHGFLSQLLYKDFFKLQTPQRKCYQFPVAAKHRLKKKKKRGKLSYSSLNTILSSGEVPYSIQVSAESGASALYSVTRHADESAAICLLLCLSLSSERCGQHVTLRCCLSSCGTTGGRRRRMEHQQVMDELS